MIFCKEIKVFSEFQADLLRMHSDLSRNRHELSNDFFSLNQQFFVSLECKTAV